MAIKLQLLHYYYVTLADGIYMYVHVFSKSFLRFSCENRSFWHQLRCKRVFKYLCVHFPWHFSAWVSSDDGMACEICSNNLCSTDCCEWTWVRRRRITIQPGTIMLVSGLLYRWRNFQIYAIHLCWPDRSVCDWSCFYFISWYDSCTYQLTHAKHILTIIVDVWWYHMDRAVLVRPFCCDYLTLSWLTESCASHVIWL